MANAGRHGVIMMSLLLSNLCFGECMTVRANTHRKISELENITDHAPIPRVNGHPKTLDCSEITKKKPIALRSYAGEFGEEVLMAVPFAYTFRRCGMLASTMSCGNMSAFYWFSPNHTNVYECERKTWGNKFVRGGGKEIAWGQFFKGYPGDWWLPAPHLEYYNQMPALSTKGQFMNANKQLVIINKYESEWGEPPVNYLSMDTVQTIVDSFTDACGGNSRVLYINDDAVVGHAHHGMAIDSQEEAISLHKDAKITTEDGMLDIDWVRKAGNSEVIQDIYDEYPDLSANEIKLRLLSKTKCFVSVQGGAGTFAFLFGGKSLVFQRRGHESGRFYNVLAPKFSGQNVQIFGNYGLLLSEFNSTFLADACSACVVRGNDTITPDPDDKRVMLEVGEKRVAFSASTATALTSEKDSRRVTSKESEDTDGGDMEGTQHVLHRSSHSSHHHKASKEDDSDFEGSQHVLHRSSKHHKEAKEEAVLLDDPVAVEEDEEITSGETVNAFTRKSSPKENFVQEPGHGSAPITELNESPKGARRMSTRVRTTKPVLAKDLVGKESEVEEKKQPKSAARGAKKQAKIVEGGNGNGAAELVKHAKKPIMVKDMFRKAKQPPAPKEVDNSPKKTWAAFVH